MARPRIQDQFTQATTAVGDRELDRQYKHQLRKRARGICLDCTRVAVGGGVYCELHAAQRRARAKAARRRQMHHAVAQPPAKSPSHPPAVPEPKPSTPFFRR